MGINPHSSPQQHGTDSHGNSVSLGGMDTDGVVVGYIDEDGTCWESLRERDFALTTARFDEAHTAWRKRGAPIIENGRVAVPNPWRIARAVCRDEDNIEPAADLAVTEIEELTRIRRAAKAAELN